MRVDRILTRIVCTLQKVQIVSFHRFNIRNFDEYLSKNFGDLKENVIKRKLNLNLQHLHEKYVEYKNVLADIGTMTTEKETIAQLMKIIAKQSESTLQQEELKSKGRIVRENLKKLMVAENKLELEIFPIVGQIPAVLCPSTPGEEEILLQSGICNKGTNHLELCKESIALRTYTLDSKQSLNVAYLTNELSLLEHTLYTTLLKQLRNLKTYEHLIHSDMVKEFAAAACLENGEKPLKILENCSSNADPLASQNLNLLGISLTGFLGYFSTIDIKSGSWVRKFYSIGRSYWPGGNSNHGLYDLSQTIQGELFSVTSDSDVSSASFEEQKSSVLSFYESLGLPFKVVRVGAASLSLNESKRIDFYMWSAGFQQYFKCGCVRSLDDHISRKLSFNRPNSRDFMKMNHSIVFKLPTIMAALIEQKQSFKIL